VGTDRRGFFDMIASLMVAPKLVTASEGPASSDLIRTSFSILILWLVVEVGFK